MPTNRMTDIPIGKIVLPDVIQSPSVYSIKQIMKSLEPNPLTDEIFVTVTEVKKGYMLVDKYDVYYAAKRLKLKQIKACVINDPKDPLATYVKLTKKDYQNPVKVIRLMRRYVDQFGMEKTLQTLHLENAFAKMYKLEFSENVLDTLDSMFDAAYEEGARTTGPFAMLRFISELEEKAQLDLIERINKLKDPLKSNFRWPHNEYLKKMIPESDKKSEKDKNTKNEVGSAGSASTGINKFQCDHCNSQYLVEDNRVTPYTEKSGVIVMEGNKGKPVFGLGKKHSKYLNMQPGENPEVITSDSGDIKSIMKKMQGRKFVIILGSKTA